MEFLRYRGVEIPHEATASVESKDDQKGLVSYTFLAEKFADAPRLLRAIVTLQLIVFLVL